ncbi:hypothetical protein Tco_1156033 [Tanacetum coccineum]
MPLSKKKEKVDVTRGKGIELLSQVTLKEDAQFEEMIATVNKTQVVGQWIKKNDSLDDNKPKSDNEDDRIQKHGTDENEFRAEQSLSKKKIEEDEKEVKG